MRATVRQALCRSPAMAGSCDATEVAAETAAFGHNPGFRRNRRTRI